MRKLRMFGLMVVAMCALGVSFVASASAEAPGKFLVNGAAIAAPVAATMEYQLLFENLRIPNFTYLCSDIFTGTIAAGGELYEITNNLRLAGEEVFESDSEANVNCAPDSGSVCSKVALSWLNLPWVLSVVLVTETDFLLLTLANGSGLLPAYFFLCEVLGLDLTELCELLPGTEQLVENGVTDVVFPAETLSTPDAHCTGENTGETINEENIGLVVDEALLFVLGVTLAISE